MPREAQTDEEIIKEAKKRFERCVTWETTARANALLDTRFAAGDAYNMYQWDPAVRQARAGRPMLTMNKARQHNLQIINDARQHKAQIKVTPTGDRATYEAAQVYSGIIRSIEYQSKAVDAYSTGIFHQVESGIGYARVVTEYIDETSFDQEIRIKRVANPRMVYLDPDATDYDKADMNFAFVFSDEPRDVSDAKYGEGYNPAPAALDHTGDGWNDKDHVREAEYWRRNEDSDTLHMLRDGTMVRESELKGVKLSKEMIDQSRDIAIPLIEWFLIVGDKIKERKEWPGKYIPIVPFIGEETVIDGIMDRKGHTRALINPQQMYNAWASAAVEQVALQSKSPYIGSARAFEGHHDVWNQANTKNFPWLPYNDVDPDNPNAPPPEKPERSQPPQMAQAYLEGMNLAREDMMMVSGQYQAEMGAPSNERSGVAIQQRQRQGDNATYHFIDNQAKAIRQIGRIIIDLIPKVYDVARVMKIMAEDGSESDVHLVPNAPQAHQQVAMTPDGPKPLTPEQAKGMQDDENSPDPAVIFNPNVGRYDVEADVGPSFGTQRQEAANAFSEIMANNPAAFQVVGDFWAQNSDFPGADELADRLKRGLPPQYKPGPDPQVQVVQQQAHELLGKADAEIAQLKQQVTQLTMQVKDKGTANAIDDYKAETDRLAALGQVDPMLVQMIARQLWENMQNTSIVGPLKTHADLEQSLMPPEPEPASATVQ
jgi:hypothetical protein